jgi:hypothetical protein
MNEPKPQGQITAQLAHYGKHYFLRTSLELKGKGIKFLGVESKETLIPQAQHLAGQRKYKVTLLAFDKVCRQYDAVSVILLD